MRIIIQNIGMRWRTVSCKVLSKTQEYSEEPSDEETERRQTLCPLKFAHLLPPWPGSFDGLGTHKKAVLLFPPTLSAAQPCLRPHGRAPTKERNLILQLLRSRDSLTQNSPRDRGFASCREVCLLLCFVMHIHAITASGGSWEMFYTRMVYP